jgi:hypothetical protein
MESELKFEIVQGVALLKSEAEIVGVLMQWTIRLC